MELNWSKLVPALTEKAFVTLTEAEGIHICDVQSSCVLEWYYFSLDLNFYGPYRHDFRVILYDQENYSIVIGWEQANLSLVLNLHCSTNQRMSIRNLLNAHGLICTAVQVTNK